MPAAPLAKGLIISLSVLFAAGLAVYENPQVRQWVDSSRRKIAIALHSLGDEFGPPYSPHSPYPDASTREDESPEAIVRRWKARQEILERARMMEERRKSRQDSSDKAKSFDDLVDKDGTLKREEEAAARTTAAEPQAEASGLHKRRTEMAGAALGSTLANPFADETHTDSYPIAPDNNPNQHSRSSTATLPAADLPPPVPPKLPLHPPQPQPQPRLLIDTEDTSTHPSEQLIDLTPTTSASSAASAAADPESHHPSNYWSVHEWAENTAPSFYSPPQSEAGSRHENSSQGTGEHASQAGSESDMDVVSEVGEGVRTPGSWTEVGSVVSEEY